MLAVSEECDRGQMAILGSQMGMFLNLLSGEVRTFSRVDHGRIPPVDAVAPGFPRPGI